jgi:hypothetical protein
MGYAAGRGRRSVAAEPGPPPGSRIQRRCAVTAESSRIRGFLDRRLGLFGRMLASHAFPTLMGVVRVIPFHGSRDFRKSRRESNRNAEAPARLNAAMARPYEIRK